MPMSNSEEALDDFPTENFNKTAESMVGAFRAEWTDQWTAASGIISKIPPSYDGLISWFKYEELIDDWLDLTVLEESKRGPALKNRFFGIAEKHKGLLNRESLRAEDGVKYFPDTMRHHFVKGAQKCVPLEISFIYSSKERETWRWLIGSASFLCSWSVWKMRGWICYRCLLWLNSRKRVSTRPTWPN